MAKRASVCCSKGLCRNTLLFLYMTFITSLTDCLFASRTLFKIFTIFTFSNLMRRVCADLNCLTTLTADHQHWTSIVQVQVLIILVFEFFIKFTTKITDILGIGYIFWWRHLNKLVLGLLKLFFFMLYRNFLSLFIRMNWSLFWVTIILATCFMEFLFYWLYYLRS